MNPLLAAVGILALVGLALLTREEQAPDNARNPRPTPTADSDTEYDGFALGV